MFILLPILIGLIAYIAKNRFSKPLLLIFQFIYLVFAFLSFLQIKNSGPQIIDMGNVPNGFAISLYVDNISAAFVLLTALIYFFLIIYAYNHDYFEPQFFFPFLSLEGLITGLFLSGDLFNLFIFLEVSTVIVSILIMYNKKEQAVYDGMIYFFVNVLGSSFFLFGIGFIYKLFGVLDIRSLSKAMEIFTLNDSVYVPFALMMVTVSLKTAISPLFSWLPKAHGTPSAPPVISAVLSGLYIKSGLYLFIRISAMYSPAVQMDTFFFYLGFATAIIGAVMSFSQTDIKLILSYSTVSQVGLIFMGLNMNSEIAFYGSVFHIFNHAIFKTALFLAAGLLTKYYKTRNIHEMNSVLKNFPLIGYSIIFSILGITGAPFFNGSISKYMIAHGTDNLFATLLLNIVNLGTILIFVKFSVILFGNNTWGKEKIKDRLSQYSVLIVSSLALLSGLFGRRVTEFLFDYPLTVDSAEYLQKGFVYVLMGLAGIALYKKVIQQNKWLFKLTQIELTFNGIITFLTGYFLLLLTILYIR